MTNEDRLQIAKVWIRSFFLEDWLTKTVAFLITLALWYGVTGSRVPTTRRIGNVRLVFQLPPETDTINDVQNKVDITVTGDKAKVAKLTADDLIVTADLTNSKPEGDLVVQLRPDSVNLDLPTGVKLDTIEPNLVSIKLEPRIEKMIPVKPAFVGQLPENLEIYETTVVPATVRVRGAASHVNALESVPTEKIDLNTKTGDFFEKQITVNLIDPKVTVVDALVNVTVRVGEKRIEKSFAGVVVHNQTTAKIPLERAVVTLYGARSLLAELSPEDISIELVFDENNAIQPRVILPDDLKDKIAVRGFKPNFFSAAK
jgi:YbbR domain-containing protein